MRFSGHSRKGYLSLELLLAIAVISLFLTLTMPGVNQFFVSTQHTLTAWESSQLCYFAKMRAMARDEDTALGLVDDGFCILQEDPDSETDLRCVSVSQSLRSTINGSGKLGFKPTGIAQYAGTFTLESDSSIHYVTVQVGAGQINVR